MVEASAFIIVKHCPPPRLFKLLHTAAPLQVVLLPLLEASAVMETAAHVLDAHRWQHDAATTTPTQLTPPHPQSKASHQHYSYPENPTSMLNLKFTYIRNLLIFTSIDYHGSRPWFFVCDMRAMRARRVALL